MLNLDQSRQVDRYLRKKNPFNSNLNVYQCTAREKAVTVGNIVNAGNSGYNSGKKCTTFDKCGNNRIRDLANTTFSGNAKLYSGKKKAGYKPLVGLTSRMTSYTWPCRRGVRAKQR